MAVSARGLFRATGKVSKPVLVRASSDLAGEIERAEHLERQGEDFYPTPPEPTRALIAHEGARLRSFPLIWEPSCGDGAMMRDLASMGFQSIGSDIVDRGCNAEICDFFDYRVPLASAIVTNPPFDKVNWRDGRGAWITHAMDTLGIEYMALLLSWSWPGAGGLGPIWAKHPPARVYLMRWKIDFTGQGAPPMLNGWFIWDRSHQGETLLRMMDRSDPNQGELL